MEPDHKHRLRQHTRLPEFDYSQPGSYFVTIVTQARRLIFGEIFNGEMAVNELGKIVAQTWFEIPGHFPTVELGEFVIMPNHIHGIITIVDEATHASQLHRDASQLPGNEGLVTPGRPQGPSPSSLGAIIGSFKSASTKMAHRQANYEYKTLWQQNYYEHVIRDDKDFESIHAYILANPMNWEKDEEYAKG